MPISQTQGNKCTSGNCQTSACLHVFSGDSAYGILPLSITVIENKHILVLFEV